METLKKVPAEIIAGDTIKFTLDGSGYPSADGWELRIAFVASKGQIKSTAVPDADDNFAFTISATDSDKFVEALYHWQLYAHQGDDRYTIDDGQTRIKVNFSKFESGHDGRSQAVITLEAIEATLQKRATSDQLSYSIAGRSLSKIPIPDLIQLRASYRATVRREKRADRIKKGLKTDDLVRFSFKG